MLSKGSLDSILPLSCKRQHPAAQLKSNSPLLHAALEALQGLAPADLVTHPHCFICIYSLPNRLLCSSPAGLPSACNAQLQSESLVTFATWYFTRLFHTYFLQYKLGTLPLSTPLILTGAAPRNAPNNIAGTTNNVQRARLTGGAQLLSIRRGQSQTQQW